MGHEGDFKAFSLTLPMKPLIRLSVGFCKQLTPLDPLCRYIPLLGTPQLLQLGFDSRHHRPSSLPCLSRIGGLQRFDDVLLASQFAQGGTATLTYHLRPLSWRY